MSKNPEKINTIEGELVEAVSKAGAPSKYSPEICHAIINVARQGGHMNAQMLAAGIRSKDTWYRWKDTYPEFKEATEYAEIISQAIYEDIGLRGIKGEIPGFNSSAWIMMMNNKYKSDYSRGTGGGTEVNITNNTVHLNDTQKIMKINHLLEKLKTSGANLVSSKKDEDDE